MAVSFGAFVPPRDCTCIETTYGAAQDPGRGVSLCKNIAGTLQVRRQASSMLLKGEEKLGVEEEKPEKTHRANARAMYINR